MGKGDKKTKRGKIVIGSYGVRRPRKKSKKFIVEKVLESKPKKPVEEQIIKPVEIPEIPVATEIIEEIPMVKKPARKAAVKKTAEKPEKAVKVKKETPKVKRETPKVKKETPKVGKEAAKTKTPKTKKKPVEDSKDKEETIRE